jgi:predicted DNA-binding transcriptional regulator YafY
VLDEACLNIEYESWNAIRRWRVDPLGLVLKGGAWYAVVRAGVRTITLRASKILKIGQLPVRFERPAGFDLQKWWAESQVRFEKELRPEVAHIRVSGAGAKRLSRHGAYATRAILDAEPTDGTGWQKVRLPIESEADAAHILLGLGDQAEVISPPSLRRLVHSMAKAIAHRHKGAS